MKTLTLLASLTLILSTAAPLKAATILFDLQGTAGFGLLPGNEPGSIVGGTGGEIGAGISYDTVTNILDLTNVGWGSSQGFTDLSSLANNSHIHGPVTVAEAAAFTGTNGVLATLTRSSNAVTGGTFTNPILDLDTIFGINAEAREAELLAGRWYINIHTANNGGGELRGFLVAVPEPSRAAFALMGLSLVAFRRKR